jgi:hypothetical protein
MAAGDVDVTIVDAPFTAASIDTALTALRVIAGANGKYLMTASADQIILAAITEA